MKSILYVGATLMIGASIYGFVDYRKTNHRTGFKEMYETKEPARVTEAPAPVTEQKTIAKEPEKTVVDKKPAPNNAARKTAVDKPSKKVVKKRKLERKLFSRAPLREEVVEVKEPVKKL